MIAKFIFYEKLGVVKVLLGRGQGLCNVIM